MYDETIEDVDTPEYDDQDTSGPDDLGFWVPWRITANHNDVVALAEDPGR